MAEKRVPFSVSWEWPDGEHYSVIASLSIHEVSAVEDDLALALEENEGFPGVAVEAATGETPVAVGRGELYENYLIEELNAHGYTDAAAELASSATESI